MRIIPNYSETPWLLSPALIIIPLSNWYPCFWSFRTSWLLGMLMIITDVFGYQGFSWLLGTLLIIKDIPDY